jgi:hypothetical protein
MKGTLQFAVDCDSFPFTFPRLQPMCLREGLTSKNQEKKPNCLGQLRLTLLPAFAKLPRFDRNPDL